MAETPDTPLTAEQLRARFGAEILVALPQGGSWRCRRPDATTLLFENLLTLPVVQQVMRDMAPNATGGKTIEDLLNDPPAAERTNQFIKQWVMLAAKSPRIVLEEAQAGADAIWIEDVPVSARLAIFNATFWAMTPAAGSAPAPATFLDVADGPAAAQRGAALPDAPEPVAAVDGSR